MEGDGLDARGADHEHDDAAIGMVDDQRFDAGVRNEASAEPRQQVLVALRLLLVGVERGAYDGVGGVVDAEQQIAAVLPLKRGSVREGGEVLADLLAEILRGDVVALPLAPLGLGRHRAQAVDEGDELRGGHSTTASSSLGSSTGSGPVSVMS
jgi:hypothetical protein